VVEVNQDGAVTSGVVILREPQLIRARYLTAQRDFKRLAQTLPLAVSSPREVDLAEEVQELPVVVQVVQVEDLNSIQPLHQEQPQHLR
jgi:hypothetical protein